MVADTRHVLEYFDIEKKYNWKFIPLSFQHFNSVCFYKLCNFKIIETECRFYSFEKYNSPSQKFPLLFKTKLADKGIITFINWNKTQILCRVRALNYLSFHNCLVNKVGSWWKQRQKVTTFIHTFEYVMCHLWCR